MPPAFAKHLRCFQLLKSCCLQVNRPLQDEGRAYISHGSSGCAQVASKTSFCACTDLSAIDHLSLS